MKGSVQKRIAIIGCGEMGNIHAWCISQIGAARLMGVCDKNTEAAANLAKCYEVDAYQSIDQMLDRIQPEIVFVCTRPTDRNDIIKRLAEANVNIFVEKPIADTVANAQEIVTIVNSRPKIRFMVGFNHRFAPAVKYAYQRLEEECLRAYHFELNFTFPQFLGGWQGAKEGGGILVSAGVHAFDLIRYFSGCEFLELSACLARLRLPESSSDDTCLMQAKLTSNKLASITMHDHSPAKSLEPFGNTIRLAAFGDALSIVVDNLTRVRLTIGDRTEFVTFAPYTRNISWGYLNQDKYFVESILEERDVYPNAEDGFRANKLVEMAKMSSNARCPVCLNS